jgi:hypothetical protein
VLASPAPPRNALSEEEWMQLFIKEFDAVEITSDWPAATRDAPSPDAPA